MKWEDKIGGLNSKYVENWFLCQTKYCSSLSCPSKMCDILACVTYWWVCVIVYYIGGHVWYIGGDGKRENMFWEIQHEMPPPLFKVNSITWIYGFQYHTYAIFPVFNIFTHKKCWFSVGIPFYKLNIFENLSFSAQISPAFKTSYRVALCILCIIMHSLAWKFRLITLSLSRNYQRFI